MEIQTPLSRRPFSDPLRQNSCVRAWPSSRRSPANPSMVYPPSTPQLHHSNPSPPLAGSDWHPTPSAIHDKTNQKNPKVSLSQDKSAFTPSRGGGVKCRILYNHASLIMPMVGQMPGRATAPTPNRFNGSTLQPPILQNSITPSPTPSGYCRLLPPLAA
jgi:hypothetical protein